MKDMRLENLTRYRKVAGLMKVFVGLWTLITEKNPSMTSSTTGIARYQ